MTDIWDPEMAGELPEPSCTFPLPPDLLGGGRFDDLYPGLPAETAVKHGQEYDDDCYLKNIIQKHVTTPRSYHTRNLSKSKGDRNETIETDAVHSAVCRDPVRISGDKVF